MMKRLDKANIPARFREKQLDDYELERGSKDAYFAIEDYLTDLPKCRESGKGLLLVGPPGTGKTLLASVVAQAAIRAGYTAYYTTLPTFIQTQLRMMELRSAWEKVGDDDSFKEWKSLKSGAKSLRKEIDFLVVDDVGKEHTTNTRFAEDEFDWLVRYRFDMGLPTILTSNLAPNEWADRYSESMESFIREAFIIVPVRGDDYRREGV